MPHYLILANPSVRARAKAMIDAAIEGTRIVFRDPKRTSDQNSKMWPMLQELADQTDWHGRVLKKEGWKMVLMSGLRDEIDPIPNWKGDGVIDLNSSTSELSVSEMSSLIEMIYAFGAQRSVVFNDIVKGT